jgi:hypothetical protein
MTELDKINKTILNQLLDDNSIDIDNLVLILNALKKPKEPIEEEQEIKQKTNNCKKIINYIVQFFYKLPFNLFGYQQYLEEDVSKCLMYAITLGFMGLGVFFDYFFLIFVSKTSKLYTFIRKIYSFVFIMWCIPLFDIKQSNVIPYLILIFICNEIGLFYVLLISIGSIYINDLTIIAEQEETWGDNEEKVKYFGLISIVLITCWSLDIRITDVPFKKTFMKLIMVFSFVYHFYFLILPEKFTIIYFKYYYNKYIIYQDLYDNDYFEYFK